MTIRITLGTIALVITAILVGLALLPDFVFFPLLGASLMIAGIVVLKSSVGWAIGLLLGGLAVLAFGIKCIRDHLRADQAEAEKAAQEVQRRLGRAYVPDDWE